MSNDDQPLSRLERARQQRRAAYLRAKEWRATDPKQIAFKEAMKLRQREQRRARSEQQKAARATRPPR